MVDQFVSGNFHAPAPDIQNDFHDIFDLALRVDAARNGEANQVHGGVFAEHQRADLHGTNAAFEIELDGERDAGKLRNRNVRQKCAR